MNIVTYHSQVPFKGQEEFRMIEVPVGLHVLWEKEGLLQSLGYMTGMPSAIMPKGGIIRNRHFVYLQLGCLSADWSTHLSHRRLLSAINGGGPPALLILRLSGLLASFGRGYLPFLRSLNVPLPP